MQETVNSWLENILGMPVEAYFEQNIVQNEWLLGIALSGAIFSIFYILRSVPQQTVNLVRRQFFNELELESDNLFYSHTLIFLSKKGYLKDTTRRLYLDERIPIISREDRRDMDWVSASGLVLGEGWHWAYFGKRPILIQHIFKDQSSTTGQRPRLLRILLPGRSNRVMSRFIREVSDFERRHHLNQVPVYERNKEEWWLSCYRDKRGLETIVWDERRKQDLRDDIDWFFKAEPWYQRRGIPYRRSFLLYGPPGTGKTSMVLAYASTFGKPIYMVNLSTIPDDGTLISVISRVPKGAFLLLEDIDAMGVDVNKRQTKTQKKSRDATDKEDKTKDSDDDKEHGSFFGITLSGLLNALDGITSPTGIVVWMTTNYPEKLDDALLRPGRVDRQIHIGYPDYEQARQLFVNFFDQPQMGKRFAQAFMDQQVYRTPADLQELLIGYHDNPEGAIRALESSCELENVA